MLRIGEVAERSGIAASAIRYYESEGLLPRPDRRNGRRVYDEAIVDQLGLIDLAKAAGFSMAEIKKLVVGFSRRSPPGERWRALTQAKMAELDERIAEAERMKGVLRVVMRCHCPTLADCSRAMRSSRGGAR
jgi:MerR family redox-sensitive transcriptional activator SoxR